MDRPPHPARRPGSRKCSVALAIATETGEADAVLGSRFARQLCLATFLPYGVVIVAALTTALVRNIAFLLIIAVSTPHVVSGFAFYFDKEARPLLRSSKYRYVILPAVGLASCSALGFFAHDLGEPTVATVVVAASLWQLHHFARQNHGVFVLITKSRRTPRPTSSETRIGNWAEVGALLGALSYFRVTAGPYVLPDQVFYFTSLLAFGAFAVAATLVVAYALRGEHGGDGVRLACLASHVVFFLPLVLLSNPYVPVIALAAPHAHQYLVIMWHMRDGRAGAATSVKTMTAALVGLAVVGGGLLYLAVGLSFSSPVSGFFKGFAVGILAWHYIMDAGVWRLSLPAPRDYMLRRLPFLGSVPREASTPG